jgi:hypothetical protein
VRRSDPGEWRTIHHLCCRLAFDGSRRRAEFGLDHQTITVLGQRVANVAELGLLAFCPYVSLLRVYLLTLIS